MFNKTGNKEALMKKLQRRRDQKIIVFSLLIGITVSIAISVIHIKNLKNMHNLEVLVLEIAIRDASANNTASGHQELNVYGTASSRALGYEDNNSWGGSSDSYANNFPAGASATSGEASTTASSPSDAWD